MWPQRWLTPVTGLRQPAPRPRATPIPIRRQPTRPGPRVTASRCRSFGSTPACSSAASTRPGSFSRWSRAATSGTTPPKDPWRATWLWIRLARTRRPSSTTATEVSSQLVSMPRVRGPLLMTRQGRVAAQAGDVGLDPGEVVLERLPEARRVDGVRPHDDRVLSVVGVVAGPPADHLEAEVLVHPLGVLVAGPHLERDPAGAEVVGRLDQGGEEDPAVAAVLLVAADADGGDMRLLVDAPHAAVADDLGDAAEHDVVGRVAAGQLAVIGVARPGGREDLLLDLLHGRDVRLPHRLDRQLLADLYHLKRKPTRPARTRSCTPA